MAIVKLVVVKVDDVPSLFNADHVVTEVGDMVVVRTDDGYKIGEVVAQDMFIKGSAPALLITELNGCKDFPPVVVDITIEGRGKTVCG